MVADGARGGQVVGGGRALLKLIDTAVSPPARAEELADSIMDSLDASVLPAAPVVSFDGSASPFRFLRGRAVLLCGCRLARGAGILAAWAWDAPQTQQVAYLAERLSGPARRAVTAMPVVGKITAMVNCRWADANNTVEVGADVNVRRMFVLESGMLEITYDSGEKVILQGPASFSADSGNGGLLLCGKLTVRKKKPTDRPLFSSIPRLPVIEQGDCQFGMDVDRAGRSHVYVLRGKVEYEVPERWARGYPLLVEEREWLFVEFKNRKYNLVCVKGNKLTEEFVRNGTGKCQ